MNCIRCGHVWTAEVESPVRCPRCTSPYWNKPRVRTRRGTSRVDEDDARGKTERAGDRAALPFVPRVGKRGKTPSTPVGLHPVPSVRSELAGRGRHNQESSSEPGAIPIVEKGSEVHQNHRTMPAGDKRWCSDCQTYYR